MKYSKINLFCKQIKAYDKGHQKRYLRRLWIKIICKYRKRVFYINVRRKLYIFGKLLKPNVLPFLNRRPF